MNILKKNLIVSLIILSLFSSTNLSLAQALSVEFETSPLFSEANFLPSDSVERYIKITNTGDREKPVVVGAINVNDPDNFAQTFSIEIRESATLLYSDTLANFFDQDEISLSNLGPGDQTQYDFTIFFESVTGDEYQEKQLGFDMVIGFLGEVAVGGEEGAGSSGTIITGGTGGGGISGAQGLQIFNETVLPVDTDQAVVTWQTNYIATSRVIYGTVSGVFDFSSPPNYGYPFSTSEFNTPASASGLVNHFVNLSGLTPGVTYYYRVISTASPATISFERNFMIDLENLPWLGDPNYFNPGDDALFSGGLVLGEFKEVKEEVEAFVESADQEISKQKTGDKTDKNEVFTAQAFAGFLFSWPWWIFLLVLIIIVYLIFRRKKEKG